MGLSPCQLCWLRVADSQGKGGRLRSRATALEGRAAVQKNKGKGFSVEDCSVLVLGVVGGFLVIIMDLVLLSLLEVIHDDSTAAHFVLQARGKDASSILWGLHNNKRQAGWAKPHLGRTRLSLMGASQEYLLDHAKLAEVRGQNLCRVETQRTDLTDDQNRVRILVLQLSKLSSQEEGALPLPPWTSSTCSSPRGAGIWGCSGRFSDAAFMERCAAAGLCGRPPPESRSGFNRPRRCLDCTIGWRSLMTLSRRGHLFQRRCKNPTRRKNLLPRDR